MDNNPPKYKELHNLDEEYIAKNLKWLHDINGFDLIVVANRDEHCDDPKDKLWVEIHGGLLMGGYIERCTIENTCLVSCYVENAMLDNHYAFGCMFDNAHVSGGYNVSCMGKNAASLNGFVIDPIEKQQMTSEYNYSYCVFEGISKIKDPWLYAHPDKGGCSMELQERVLLLSGHTGNIFTNMFDPRDVNYYEIDEIGPDIEESFERIPIKNGYKTKQK